MTDQTFRTSRMLLGVPPNDTIMTAATKQVKTSLQAT